MRPNEDSQEKDPALRRAVSRRTLLTDEFARAGTKAVKQLPGLAGMFGSLFKEMPDQRERRLVDNLWQLFMGRIPKPSERSAGLDVVRNAVTADEKADALVDILWALCQTQEFDELKRPDVVLVRGLYRISLDRAATDAEATSALEVLKETTDPAARVAALEGLLTGLLRSSESVLRQTA